MVAFARMEPDQELAPPSTSAKTPTPADLQRVAKRQQRVIEMLREQIGNVVLAHTEQAALIEELVQDNAQLRERVSFESSPQE